VWANFKERFGIETIAEFYAATEGPSGLFNLNRNEFTDGAVGYGGALSNTLLGANSAVLEMDYDENKPLRDPKTGFCVPVKPSDPGELVFKLDEKEIDAKFQGYYRNKGASSSKILRDVLAKGDAWFSTGDIMRKDLEGRWFFNDRIGDTYRWKSENVSTAEVAEVVGQKREFIDEANVYGVLVPGHDGRAGCAAILLNDGAQAKFNATGDIEQRYLDDLAAYAQKQLPRYAVPIFLRIFKDEANAYRTGTNKQQKHHLRNEGVDPTVVKTKGDRLYWIPPGEKTYRQFAESDWKSLGAGQVKL